MNGMEYVSQEIIFCNCISLFEEFLFEKLLLITVYCLVHCQVAVACYLYRMYYFVPFLKVVE